MTIALAFTALAAFGQQTQTQTQQSNCENYPRKISDKNPAGFDAAAIGIAAGADIAAQHSRYGWGYSQAAWTATSIVWARKQQQMNHDQVVADIYRTCKDAEAQNHQTDVQAGVEHHRIDADQANHKDDVAAQVYHDTVQYDKTATVSVKDGTISTSNLLSRQDAINLAALANWRAGQK